ncbi:MAG: phenylalanine--tRNA ligase subunit beta [Candidatus Kapabacteria bacterium]|nr:phenylalanine--tRNA ligase subunit beta [Candidatus Kapabacteria bacterium]
MNISLNWLKEFVDFEYTATELDKILTMLGIEVEKIHDYRSKYNNFFIAYVESCEKHPDADKLSVCKVSLGNQNLLNIVCGAPNVAAGQKIVLGVIGAVVPKGGFALERRKIRKVESEGMICSSLELDLGDDSSGIWVMPENAPVGMPLAEYLNINDTVLEISVTPNRADCLSHLGIAREIANYSGKKVKLPDFTSVESDSAINDCIQVIIDDIENCPRYTARVLMGASGGQSPAWLVNRLKLLGMRPINLAADVTNLVMLELGQPLHAFDYDKISGQKIIVKLAENGDKFITLDGKERALDAEMLMICDAEKQIAIAGLMGGANTEISSDTKNILIESAFFNPTSVRRSSKRLGLSSESSYRFERGVDYNMVDYACNRAAALIAQYSGATIMSDLINVYPVKIQSKIIELDYMQVSKLSGTEFSNKDIRDYLLGLSFEIIDDNETKLTVKAPSYRVDMDSSVDLIEEIVRIYNYDNIQPDFTTNLNFGLSGIDKYLSVPPLRARLRNYLVNSGYNEILTQNMIDPASAAIFNQNLIEISNPLGDELSIMRPSLIPSMIRTIERNLRNGNKNLHFFEIGHSFYMNENDCRFIPGVSEKENLIIALCGKSTDSKNWDSPDRSVDFYDLKGLLESMIKFLGLDTISFKTGSESDIFSKNNIELIHSGSCIGKFGELNPVLLKKFNIEIPVYIADVNLNYLYDIQRKRMSYSNVSVYPAMSRDLCFIVAENLKSADIQNCIISNAGNLLRSTAIFDVYAGKNLGNGMKSLAYTLVFGSDERTLIDSEVDSALQKIIKAVETGFNAELRKI